MAQVCPFSIVQLAPSKNERPPAWIEISVKVIMIQDYISVFMANVISRKLIKLCLMTQLLTLELLLEGTAHLARIDPDLAGVVAQIGPPPLWSREPGFATLIYIILEQQVSLASARAAYNRLIEQNSPLTPEVFLTLDDVTLKTIGFSRQKTAYGRYLAQALLDGKLNLTGLGDLTDDAVRVELIKIKGIGHWTAEIYLMEALLRPDVWPKGDLALALAVKRVKHLLTTPNPIELEAIGEAYRPWRAVAARLFWHHYLSMPGRKSTSLPGV
jgi:DNA-3-methyladenine glycosylase II